VAIELESTGFEVKQSQTHTKSSDLASATRGLQDVDAFKIKYEFELF
jgi:hypothetical protein